MNLDELLTFSVTQQCLGPASVGWFAADDPGGRRCPPHQRAPAGAQAGPRPDLRHHERQAAQGLRRIPGVRLLVRDSQAGPVPRQRLQPEPGRGGRVSHHSHQDPDAGGSGLSAGVQGSDRYPARVDPGHRSDRFGQVHHPGGDDRPYQQERVRPHPDHRGSDRVRSPEPALPGQPARGASRHAGVQRGPALGAARGPGHHSGRRNARPGNHQPGA